MTAEIRSTEPPFITYMDCRTSCWESIVIADDNSLLAEPRNTPLQSLAKEMTEPSYIAMLPTHGVQSTFRAVPPEKMRRKLNLPSVTEFATPPFLM